MGASFFDWVVETSSTTGTGAYALSGSPPAGTSYFTFRQRYSNGDDKVCYWVVNADRTKWEKNRFGTLTYGGPDTLSRNVVESTSGDAAISWVGGDTPLRIYCVPDADAEEFAISMGLGASRPDVLKYGLWADEDGTDTDVDQVNLFDGTSDIPVFKVDRGNHTVEFACMPAGVVLPFAGASAPTGFLLCYGQAIDRDDYARLFDAIGTTYGVGDGSTTFNLPDLRGRVVAGQDDMGGTSANRLTDQSGGVDGDVLGDTGGAETHTLSTAELAAHGHATVGGANIVSNTNTGAGIATLANGADVPLYNAGAVTANAGSGAAHNNVQPTIILNYIISTGGA